MRHAGALACTEREAPFHHPVCQGGGKEPQTADKGGAAGYFEEVLTGLCGNVGGRGDSVLDSYEEQEF